jgi:hypothetical protein
MWNPFRPRNKGSEGSQSRQSLQHNRVDELANTLQREGRIRDLESELTKLDKVSLSLAEQESWWHLFGIVAFQDGRDAEALARFEEAYKRFPASAHIRFSLGQQYVRTKAVDKGFELFRTCSFPNLPREHVLAQARYAYLWGRYGDGLTFIRPFFEAYKPIKILDDHFLYVRGLPFFGQWWAYLAAFSILSDDLRELESVTQFVVANCHDYDFDYLQAELKAYRYDNPDYLLESLMNRLRSVPSGDFPTGYTRMNIAVIEARRATSLQAANEVLGSVRLFANDFPWLEDIRSLAQAESAYRFGDMAFEQVSVGRFLGRQPMLFEPDIALNFHMLRYQERLKPRVVAI